jgi:hypothetical protein
MRKLLLAAMFMTMATGGTAILVACTGGEDPDGGSTEDIKAAQGLEGAACNAEKKCKAGLVCKAKSNGPPPGALGMPIHTNSAPPGALGMPAPVTDTCQKPLPGEEGSECRSTSECSKGLSCEIDHTSSSSSSGPPPGVLGMPILPKGTCQQKDGSSSSGGPPPGALGMPIHN